MIRSVTEELGSDVLTRPDPQRGSADYGTVFARQCDCVKWCPNAPYMVPKMCPMYSKFINLGIVYLEEGAHETAPALAKL